MLIYLGSVAGIQLPYTYGEPLGFLNRLLTHCGQGPFPSHCNSTQGSLHTVRYLVKLMP